ncbi:MAG: hypothetical protein ACLP01_18720 [Solirubrobacteraceae bacterium]
MGKIRTDDGQHKDAIDELLEQVEAAFTGSSFWAPFLERAHAAGIPRLSDWLNTTGRIVEEQLHRRGPRWKRPADIPLTTSRLDAFINPIRASIQPRAYGLKNRERTNRLLMLMQLRKPPRRRARLRPAHPRDPRGQPGPSQHRTPRDHRYRRQRVTTVTLVVPVNANASRGSFSRSE